MAIWTDPTNGDGGLSRSARDLFARQSPLDLERFLHRLEQRAFFEHSPTLPWLSLDDQVRRRILGRMIEVGIEQDVPVPLTSALDRLFPIWPPRLQQLREEGWPLADGRTVVWILAGEAGPAETPLPQLQSRIEALGELGANTPAVRSLLVSILDNIADSHSAPPLAEAVIWTLVRIDAREEEAIASLARFVRSPAVGKRQDTLRTARRDAVEALGTLGRASPVAAEALKDLLGSRDREMKRLAARALGSLDVDLYALERELLAYVASDQVARNGNQERTEGYLDALVHVSRRLLHDHTQLYLDLSLERRGWLRPVVLRHLGAWGASDAALRPRLHEALRNSDRELRIAAVQALGDLGLTSQDLPLIRRALRGEGSPRRGHPSVIDAVLDTLIRAKAYPQTPPDVRLAVTELLQELENREPVTQSAAR